MSPPSLTAVRKGNSEEPPFKPTSRLYVNANQLTMTRSGRFCDQDQLVHSERSSVYKCADLGGQNLDPC